MSGRPETPVEFTVRATKQYPSNTDVQRVEIMAYEPRGDNVWGLSKDVPHDASQDMIQDAKFQLWKSFLWRVKIEWEKSA